MQMPVEIMFTGLLSQTTKTERVWKHRKITLTKLFVPFFFVFGFLARQLERSLDDQNPTERDRDTIPLPAPMPSSSSVLSALRSSSISVCTGHLNIQLRWCPKMLESKSSR